MASELSSEQLRQSVVKVLESYDDIEDPSITIGSVRGDVEKLLGLGDGALLKRKAELKKFVSAELQPLLKDPERKRRKLEKAAEKKDETKAEQKVDKKPEEKVEKKPEQKVAPKADLKQDSTESKNKVAPPADDAENQPFPVVTATARQAALAVSTPIGGVQQDAPVPAKPAIRQLALSGAEDGFVRLWDLGRSACEKVFEGHVGAVVSLVADWTEVQAVSGAEDGARLWDLRRGGCLRSYPTFENEGGCTALAALWSSASHKVLLGCGDGKLRLCDMHNGERQKEIDAHPGGVWALDVSWKKQRAVSGGDQFFILWEMSESEDWTMLKRIEGHAGGIMCLSVDWSREDSPKVVVGSGDQSLKLCQTEGSLPKGFVGHKDSISCVQAHWKEKVLLSGGWDAQLRLWNLGNQSTINQFECSFGRVRSMSADLAMMQVICGSSNGCLHHLDLKTGEQLGSFEGHIGGVTSLLARLG